MSDNCNNDTACDAPNDSLLKCSSFKCVTTDDDLKQLQCCSCQRWVHYKCKQLPPYMIQAFVEKRIKKYYYCASCITVPEDLIKEVNQMSNEQNEIIRLRREIKRCENLIKITEENSRMMNELLTDKINQLEENKVEKIIDAKLEKFESILKENQNREESKSYASVTNTQPNDFKSIMKIAKIEEISEERDRRSRMNNIILHGVKEDTDENNDTTNDKDKKFVDQFFFTLEESHKKPSFIGRIGKKSSDKNRPIKIVFKNENEKKVIFRKLRMLKGKDDFKGISVAEDYTESERKVLKTWTDKAKERNNNEKDENTIWRVRGSPKNGTMRLKKFSINSSQQ